MLNSYLDAAKHIAMLVFSNYELFGGMWHDFGLAYLQVLKSNFV